MFRVFKKLYTLLQIHSPPYLLFCVVKLTLLYLPAFDSAKDGSDSNAIILPGKRMNKKKGKTKVYGTKCLYLTRSPILVHRI